MICRKCGEDKPETEFELRRDSGRYRTECKLCRANSEAARRYGVTVGDVDRLREKQGNRCAVCDTYAYDISHSAFTHNPLVIDHDHESGKVRGLLCSNCNFGIGHFKDSKELLQRAIIYLNSQ